MGWRQRRAYYAPYAWPALRALWHAPFYPAYYPIAWLLGRMGVRFLVSRPGQPRIGHLALEPHFYVKAGLVDARREFKAIMLGSRGMVANECLRDYWRPFFKITTNPIVELPLRPLAWMKPTRLQLYPVDVEIAVDGQRIRGMPACDEALSRYYDMHNVEPLFNLTPEHEERGVRTLERLGMPRGAWFVSVHVREGGFIPSARTKMRNRDIHVYLNAIQLITERGGWVVRLGNPTMTPLPQLPQVIDYVFTDTRSEWMDIFLLARCRFFLGSDSGPAVVPPLFGRPCAIADSFPLGHGWWPGDLYIKQLCRSLENDRILTFPEAMSSGLRDLFTPDQCRAARIQPVPNTEDEIAALAEEMVERSEGVASYTEEDEWLQQTYLKLLFSQTTQFTFGSRSRVGRDFLRHHKALLEAPPTRTSTLPVRV